MPAHAWTPWFAVLGAKSGPDTVADCCGDLVPHIFAIETGRSGDQPMNSTCSSLDDYYLSMTGDHRTVLTRLRRSSYIRKMASTTPTATGNAACALLPAQTCEHDGGRRECGKPLIIGVKHRTA